MLAEEHLRRKGCSPQEDPVRITEGGETPPVFGEGGRGRGKLQRERLKRDSRGRKRVSREREGEDAGRSLEKGFGH